MIKLASERPGGWVSVFVCLFLILILFLIKALCLGIFSYDTYFINQVIIKLPPIFNCLKTELSIIASDVCDKC